MGELKLMYLSTLICQKKLIQIYFYIAKIQKRQEFQTNKKMSCIEKKKLNFSNIEVDGE